MKERTPNKSLQPDSQKRRMFCKERKTRAPFACPLSFAVGCKKKTPIHHKQSHHRTGFVKMMALFCGIDEAMAVDKTEKKMRSYLTGLQERDVES